MSPALCEWCGGAELNGLGLMKNHCGQWLLLQRQHIELGLQHSLKVLMEKERNTLCFKQTYKQHYTSISLEVNISCFLLNTGGG